MADTVSLSRQLSFFRIDDSVRQELARLWPIIEPELPAILDDFYQHLNLWPEMSKMFTDTDSMGRARNAQIRLWERLFSGRFDPDYAAAVKAVGRRHQALGLDTTWYIGGYTFVLNRLCEVINRNFGGRGRRKREERRTKAMDAVQRAIMFDMQLAISIYLEEGEAGKRRTLDTISSRFDDSIGSISAQIHAAVEQLHEVAHNLTGVAQRTTEQASQVSAASEQASVSVETVAAAAQQLDNAIGEIGRQAAQSAKLVNSARSDAESVSSQVEGLNEAAVRIGDSVGLIKDIAEQTNMLALNATIEASRAGTAGRGFAVVADEVKTLAAQTAKVSDEIVDQVARVQAETRQAVTQIRRITGRIQELDQVATSISSSVEEQGAAIGEISRSVHEAAAGTREVAGHMTELSGAANTTGTASQDVAAAVRQLSEQALRLRHEAPVFIAEVKAA